jgi:outer membrane protein assembly factor BamB
MKKTKVAIIISSLILTFATLIPLAIVSGHDPPWEVPTWTYINAAPSTVGVGQRLLISIWSNTVPPTAGGAYGDRWTFYIDMTKPDNSEETLGPITSDPVGAAYRLIYPDQVGTYTFVARMDEHFITGLPENPNVEVQPGADYVNDTYTASTSDPITVTVQEGPIEEWAGNWLGGAAQTATAASPLFGQNTRFGFGPAPESAHILWTKPYWAGGIMDYRTEATGYQTGHYQGLTFSPLIIHGKIYYAARNTAHTTQGYDVVDLYTGETLSLEDETMPAFGSIYDYESPNQHGGFPYLWRTSGVTLPEGYTSQARTQTWEMIDAYTGEPITIIANVSSGGTAVYGKDGSILRYSLATSDGVQYLRCWNVSAIPSMLPGTSGTELWQWRPAGHAVHDGNQGWSLNVSISPPVEGGIFAVLEGEYIIGGTSGVNKEGEPLELGNMWALSLEPGHEGDELWSYEFTPPFDVAPAEAYGGMYRGQVFGPAVVPEEDVFYFVNSLTQEIWCYDLENGNMLWETANPEPDLQYFGLYNYVYQGKLLTFGYSGILYAYDIQNGTVLWEYTAEGIGYESPYGNYPIYAVFVADGKVYLVSGEHSPTQPLWRGPNLRCVDVETGEEVWKILFWGAGAGGGHLSATMVAMADGYIIGLNYYDNQIYCFGKGPTETTVNGPDNYIPLGEEVLIKGTVTDQSPGTEQLEQAKRFPNGVPVVADDYQEDWMEYVYAQQPCPEDAEGVEVVLTTLDPNNNTYEIGRTTTSLSGAYGCAFKPEVTGLYKIIATFEGSDAYYRSYSETYINVGEAPSPGIEPTTEPPTTEPPTTAPPTTEPPTTAPPTTEPPTTAPPPTGEAPLITTEVAIVVSVAIAAIIGVAAYWALRRRQVK